MNYSFSLCVTGIGEAWLKSEKHAEFGTEISLECVLKLPQCIGLHSIKWYQGNKRIFVYSAEGETTLSNDDLAARYVVVQFTFMSLNAHLVTIKFSRLGLFLPPCFTDIAPSDYILSTSPPLFFSYPLREYKYSCSLSNDLWPPNPGFN